MEGIKYRNKISVIKTRQFLAHIKSNQLGLGGRRLELMKRRPNPQSFKDPN